MIRTYFIFQLTVTLVMFHGQWHLAFEATYLMPVLLQLGVPAHPGPAFCHSNHWELVESRICRRHLCLLEALSPLVSSWPVWLWLARHKLLKRNLWLLFTACVIAADSCRAVTSKPFATHLDHCVFKLVSVFPEVYISQQGRKKVIFIFQCVNVDSSFSSMRDKSSSLT